MIANAADGKTTMPDDRDAIDALGTVARLDIEHEIKHFLYLPTESAADRVRTALTTRNFIANDFYQIFGTWCVTVRTVLVPEESAIVELRRIFTEIAEENDGEYDGWEADLRTEEQKAEDRRNGGIG
jgi:phage pi2 protein 07